MFFIRPSIGSPIRYRVAHCGKLPAYLHGIGATVGCSRTTFALILVTLPLLVSQLQPSLAYRLLRLYLLTFFNSVFIWLIRHVCGSSESVDTILLLSVATPAEHNCTKRQSVAISIWTNGPWGWHREYFTIPWVGIAAIDDRSRSGKLLAKEVKWPFNLLAPLLRARLAADNRKLRHFQHIPKCMELEMCYVLQALSQHNVHNVTLKMILEKCLK